MKQDATLGLALFFIIIIVFIIFCVGVIIFASRLFEIKNKFYEYVEKKRKKKVSVKLAAILWYGFWSCLAMSMTIFILVDLLNFFNLGTIMWQARFFNHFFVDGDNKFNWVGITSVLAILSLSLTAWDSRRKMKADLVSKSRIKWLEDSREQISDLISVYYRIINDIAENKKQENTGREDCNSKEVLLSDLYKYSSLSILMLGNDSETDCGEVFDGNPYKLNIAREYKNKLMRKSTNEEKNNILVGLIKEVSEILATFINLYKGNEEFKKIPDYRRNIDFDYDNEASGPEGPSEQVNIIRQGFPQIVGLREKDKGKLHELNKLYEKLVLPKDYGIFKDMLGAEYSNRYLKFTGKEYDNPEDDQEGYEQDLEKMKEVLMRYFDLYDLDQSLAAFIDEFIDIMRLYYKIEWNIAKDGK